jgi:hypothetical protein
MPKIYDNLRKDSHIHVCPLCKNEETGRPFIWLHANLPPCTQLTNSPCPKCAPITPAMTTLAPDIPKGYYNFPVRVTEQARSALAIQAHYAGYIKRPHGEKARGIGEYITRVLAIHNYLDTRPSQMKQMDYLPLYNYGKMWLPEGDIRLYAKFRIHTDAYTKLYQIGVEHRIENMTRLDHTTHMNTVGLVLEAIGRKWLTPCTTE